MDGALGSLKNASSAFIPSAGDLLMVGPRLVQRAIAGLPEPFNTFFDMLRLPGAVIADATATSLGNDTLVPSTTSFIQNVTAAGASALASATPQAADGFLAGISKTFGFQLQNLDGIFSYLLSRCEHLILALLNLSTNIPCD